MRWAERRFRAMGTDVHLLVGGSQASEHTARAARRIRGLERRWSRFDPTSEISTLNRAGGRPMTVSPDTFTLVERAVAAWRLTGGAFDPTVLDALDALGYDRDFATLTGETVVAGHPSRRSRGCAGIVLSRETRLVRLPEGVRFDPGGIGKGLAADLVIRELVDDGAHGVCVNVGGDLRVTGRAPRGAGWVVDVELPAERPVGCLRLARGAVATTSCTRRGWRTTTGDRHHVVDPSTGDSARSGLSSVTVVTGRAWRSEVLAKAAFVAGPEAGAVLVDRRGAAALLVGDDGEVRQAGRITELLV